MKHIFWVFHAKGCAVIAQSFIALCALCVATTISAATDLGEDCCADLEERITEMEATTARKGNRKVGLTVSVYVAQELTFWDNGAESNAYLHGRSPTHTTRIKFPGQAAITPGWKACNVLRLQILKDDPFARGCAAAQPLMTILNF